MYVHKYFTQSLHCCSLHRKLYHPNNAALGLATMRAGVTHWQAGFIEIGHGMICKAFSILMITHGATHPITKDLEVRFSHRGTHSTCLRPRMF